MFGLEVKHVLVQETTVKFFCRITDVVILTTQFLTESTAPVAVKVAILTTCIDVCASCDAVTLSLDKCEWK
jgi:hypothetical protein